VKKKNAKKGFFPERKQGSFPEKRPQKKKKKNTPLCDTGYALQYALLLC